jgi:signal transduction histidine kinase
LRPITWKIFGLVTALDMLTEEMSHGANLPVEFQRQGVERRLDPDVELALYRIAQEALNNVVRHAQATQAHLNIYFTSQDVTLEVTDNGKGFDVPSSPAEFAPAGHFGLLGLSERAELIGARLEIQSSLDHGSRVTLHLPG